MGNKTPQLENGYVRIANEIIDKLCSYRLSGEEWQVLLVILRKTYGFQKKKDYISYTQFEKLTGLKRASVFRAIKKLLAKKLIGVSKNANSPINLYCFNKLYSQWRPISKKATPISKNANTLLAKMLPTKENITKENIYIHIMGENKTSPKNLENSSFSSVREILEKKGIIRRRGISTPWQETAFRYAHGLKINLKDGKLKARWLKFFKEADQRRLSLTYAFLFDYSPFFSLKDPGAKIKYFFWAYGNKK